MFPFLPMVTYRRAAKNAFIGNYGAKNKYLDRVKPGMVLASKLWHKTCYASIIRVIYNVLKWLVFNRQNTGKIKLDYIPRLRQKKCKIKQGFGTNFAIAKIRPKLGIKIAIAKIRPKLGIKIAIAKFVPCREFHKGFPYTWS